jgi:hypothetical protein
MKKTIKALRKAGAVLVRRSKKHDFYAVAGVTIGVSRGDHSQQSATEALRRALKKPNHRHPRTQARKHARQICRRRNEGGIRETRRSP